MFCLSSQGNITKHFQFFFSLSLARSLVFPSRVDAMHGLYLEKENGNCGCAVECQEAKILSFFFSSSPSIRSYFRHHFFLFSLVSPCRCISIDISAALMFCTMSVRSYLHQLFLFSIYSLPRELDRRTSRRKIEKYIKLIIHSRRTHLVFILIITRTSKSKRI